jgi:hypothetical protein
MADTAAYLTPTSQRIIDSEVDRILLRHGVSPSSPVKEMVRERMSVGLGSQNVAISVLDENGTSMKIEDYLVALKRNPAYAPHFRNADRPRIASTDETKLRDNFSKIARGEVEVTDDL